MATMMVQMIAAYRQ